MKLVATAAVLLLFCAGATAGGPDLSKPLPLAFARDRLDIPFSTALTLFDGLVGADLIQTRQGLARGFVEANPVMKPIVGNPPLDIVFKLGQVWVLNAIFKWVYAQNPVLGWVFLGAAVLGQGLVVQHNAELLRGQ